MSEDSKRVMLLSGSNVRKWIYGSLLLLLNSTLDCSSVR